MTFENEFIQIRSSLANLTDNEIDVKVCSEIGDKTKREHYIHAAKLVPHFQRVNIAATLIANEHVRKRLKRSGFINDEADTERDVFVTAQMAKLAAATDPPISAEKVVSKATKETVDYTFNLKRYSKVEDAKPHVIPPPRTTSPKFPSAYSIINGIKKNDV